MDPTSDSALRELFEREANDELDGIERLLDRSGDPEAAARLYRHAHTIKGSAAVMGLDEVAGLANLLEEIFDHSRTVGSGLELGAEQVITAAVADLRYLVSCRLNQVDASETVRDTHSALLALREQLSKPTAIVSDRTTTQSNRQRTAHRDDANATHLSGLGELVYAMAAAELALLRLVASTAGVRPEHIPEYAELEQLLAAAIPGSVIDADRPGG